MKPGIYDDISNEQYHGGPGLSKSGLDRIAKSPAHFKAYLDGEHEQTKAMVDGTLFHTLTLEPELFDVEFAVEPSINRRTKAGKEEYAAWEADNAGKTIVSLGQVEQAEAMADAVNNNKAAAALMNGAVVERSVFWEDPATGILCKCRPDIMNMERRVLVDLKSTLDASPVGFAKSIANFRYHVQAAFYLDGVNQQGGPAYDAFVFICCEKQPPYAVAVYMASDEMVAKGRMLAMQDLDTYAKCLAENHWPGFPEKIVEIELPRWAA